MKKFKFMLLFFVFVGCIVYTNFLEKSAVSGDTLEANDTNETSSKVLLYFLNASGDVTPEYRFVSLDDLKEDMVTLLVKELLVGTCTSGNRSAVPSGTKLISAKISGNVASVNFSKEFLENEDASISMDMKVDAVTKTLTEIKEVDTVEILVEGEVCEVRGRPR